MFAVDTLQEICLKIHSWQNNQLLTQNSSRNLSEIVCRLIILDRVFVFFLEIVKLLKHMHERKYSKWTLLADLYLSESSCYTSIPLRRIYKRWVCNYETFKIWKGPFTEIGKNLTLTVANTFWKCFWFCPLLGKFRCKTRNFFFHILMRFQMGEWRNLNQVVKVVHLFQSVL